MDYYRNHSTIPNKKIEQFILSLDEDDYLTYHQLYENLPNDIKNHRTPYGILRDALELVIENGTLDEFEIIWSNANNRCNVYEYVTNCAFYGRLTMLQAIVESDIIIENIALSNALIIALNNKHYDIAEYLLERNVNNILAYDYILKYRNSNFCEYLFNKYGNRMKRLYNSNIPLDEAE